MLEQLRRNSRSFIIWVLFAIIIAAFVLTFGTQGGVDLGCGGARASHVLIVDGKEVPISSWRFGMNTTQSRTRTDRAQLVLDQLLLREILAQAAEDAGYQVDQDMVADHIRRGTFWVFGSQQDGRSYFLEKTFEAGNPGQPVWILNFDRLNALVQGWGLASVDLFIEEQQRELLADLMRGTLTGAPRASAEEALVRFQHENDTVTFDAVMFRPLEYRRQLSLSDEQVAEYLASHEQEVQAKYKEDERLYQDINPEVRIRQIRFARQAPPAAEGEAESQPDPGREAADKARAELAAGADFAALAAERTEDERSRARGGDLGWRALKSPGLGAQELTDAVASLQVGAVSDVIAAPHGYFILKIEDRREGNLSFDQVKHELAEKMALEHHAREAARRDAQAALDQSLAGTKLEEQFERGRPASPAFDPSQLPPELLQQLSPEQIQQLIQQAAGDEHGSIVIESDAIPAQSGAAQATHRPRLQRIGPLQRDAGHEISSIGTSEELTTAIFEQLGPGQVAPRVFEIDSNFVVVQVLERNRPDMSLFDEAEKERLMRAIVSERGYGLYRDWLKERCHALVNAGKVSINQPFLSQISDDPARPFRYQACSNIQ